MPRDASRRAVYTLGPDGLVSAFPAVADPAAGDGQRPGNPAAVTSPAAGDGQRPGPGGGQGSGSPAPAATRPLTVTPLASGDGVRIDGDIDLSTRQELERVLAALPADGGTIHLHLGGLGFIDVGGSRTLVALARRLAPGSEVVLHDPPYALIRILQLICADATGPDSSVPAH